MTENNKPGFDEALRELRRQELDEASVSASGARVWNALRAELEEPAPAVEKIRGCHDVQALLPAYGRGVLPEGRALLVREHLQECSDCRMFAKSHTRTVEWQPAPPLASWGLRQFAVAAMLLVVVGLFSWGTYATYFAPVPGSRAQVQSVEGKLIALSHGSERVLKAGDEIQEDDIVRTAAGSHAFLRLRDGSVVEVNERAEFSVSARRNNTTVELARGNVIVQAAKRRSGNLFVQSNDCRVAVTGTVFAVNSGTKGSRVSVVEGEVQVSFAGEEAVLHAGDQVATSPSMGRTSVQDEIAWSRELQKHLALLAEFADLQRKLDQVRMPQLRYSSRILPLLPNDSVVYISIPNYGQALAEAHDIFKQQLQQSDVLRQWWTRNNADHEAEFQRIIERLKALSDYIGEEIVISVAKPPRSEDGQLIVIAEIRRAGLKEFLEAEMQKEPRKDSANLKIYTPETLGTAVKETNAAYLLVKPELMIFSNDLQAVNWAAALSETGGNGLPDTQFGQRLAAVYERGAGVFLAIDLAAIIESRPPARNAREAREYQTFDASGFTDAKFLLAERKTVNGVTETRVSLQFRGERRGMASWLAAPAGMGSLEYVSANAAAAFSAVSKSPSLMLDDLFAIAAGDSSFRRELAEAEAKLGFSIRDDLAAALGGEVTFALDGPVLPTPSWKLIAETHDPARLQHVIGQLASTVNDRAAERGGAGVKLTSEEVNGRTFYTFEFLQRAGGETGGVAAVHYTFAEGYLVAGPSRAMVTAALRTRSSGGSLARSGGFRSLMPSDTNANCSALAYQNLAPVVHSLMQLAGAENAARLQALSADSRPTLLCAYGESDRVQLATNSRFFGLDLNTVALSVLLDRQKRQNGTNP